MAEIVSTGIERLDEALIDGKGITMGSSVLIQGSSGSGKELLAKQFASAGIGSENVVYFSTDETSDELIDTFEQYRWPTDLRIVNIGTQYFEKVLSRELQASRFKQEGLSVAELRNIGSYGSTADQINFVADMTYEISKLRSPFRVVIDSLDFFLQYYDPGDVLSAMRTIKEYAQANGGTVMYTVTEGAHAVSYTHLRAHET